MTNIVTEKGLPKVSYPHLIATNIKLAGINKPISFHCARHTFATTTLGLSSDITVVSKILGHTKIETTQIYAKVQDEQKRKAMGMWNAR